MPAKPDDPAGQDEDVLAQIARLRAQIDVLMREQVAPALANASERAGEVGNQIAGQVRQQPLTAILVAAAIGFLLGRESR